MLSWTKTSFKNRCMSPYPIKNGPTYMLLFNCFIYFDLWVTPASIITRESIYYLLIYLFVYLYHVLCVIYYYIFMYTLLKYFLKGKYYVTKVMLHCFCMALLTTVLIYIFFYLLKTFWNKIYNHAHLFKKKKKHLRYSSHKWYAKVTKPNKFSARINIQFSWITIR